MQGSLTNPDSPTLTVVTPVLNGARFLPACLESVRRAATLRPGAVEHIVADGGSSDGSLEMARAAMQKPGSPVVRVLEGPDRGQSHAINRAMADARGVYVAWLNADDVYEPTALADVLDAMRGSYAGFHIARAAIVDRAGETIYRPVPLDPFTPTTLLRLLTVWFAGGSIIQPEAFIRRDLWREVGGLQESNHHSMDYALWLALAERGVPVERHRSLVAKQLAHPDQKTADNEAVVRSMLGDAEASIERSGCRDGQALSEVAVVRERLRALDRVREAARRFTTRRCVAAGLPWNALWSEAAGGLTLRLSDAGSTLLLDAPKSIAFPAGVQTVSVHGKLPSFPPSFNRVIACAPTLRYGPDAIASITACLRPGGRAFVVGDPEPAGCRAMDAMVRTYLADGLSQPPSRSPLDLDLAWARDALALSGPAEPTETTLGYRVRASVRHRFVPVGLERLSQRLGPVLRSFVLAR